ncbi:MAG TPA: CDP-alcohol phosphatidyltransferase family protein [Gemmatimonadaceae bacterium]|nr:CDP-alcohol phosphatidyltransferase family protein [Gemmatimonadaceae bacterium]
MNLPNALTVGRIAATPLIALLPFASSWELKLAGFLLYLVAAISDYYDGVLARTRGLVTDLGKLLDPLADKLLLLGTLVPIYLLMAGVGTPLSMSFVTPWGRAAVPLWVVLVVLGRELVMTIFRQAAARRGVIIAAIGPAKWKMGFQSVWVGASYFWFAARDAQFHYLWVGPWWRAFAQFNGIVGVASMWIAVALTIYSLLLYFARYGAVFAGRGARDAGRVRPPADPPRNP